MNAAKNKPVWVLYHDTDFEGISAVIGVFPTAIQAMRAIDKDNPPTLGQEWTSGSYYTRACGIFQRYTVERFRLGRIEK